MATPILAPVVIALAFAAAMIFQRNLYSGALCLLMVLVQIAVVFYQAGAPLLAMVQVLIYAGSVMILIVIAIMVVGRPARPWARLTVPRRLIAALAGLGLMEGCYLAFRSGGIGAGPGVWATGPGVWATGPRVWAAGTMAVPIGPAAALPASPENLERAMASVLFGPYALMTEAVGLLVLIAALAILNDSSTSGS